MNLIICQTPLQVLIAEKIIEKYPKEIFYGLLLDGIKNDKYQYYYQRLKRRCTKCDYICTKKPYIKWEFYKLVFKRIANLHKFTNIDKIFLANTDTELVHLYIGDIYKTNIITFDDGLANINFKDTPFLKDRLRSRTKLLRNFIDIPTTKDILAHQIKHYSLYNLPNIMGKYEKLNLFDEIRVSECEKTEDIHILLGQPIFESLQNAEKSNVEIIQKVLSRYHIDFYYPHPRETYKIREILYINTPLIFEDWLIQQVQQHPNKKYVIYTFFSSVVLNLGNLPNLEIIALKPQDCPKRFLFLYNFFEKYNISIRNI
ncbi:glycosyltransferase family 52 [Pasteurella skyensis]|uniref:Glycosyltransferase family 52 n=1 Tax=Phocoenobacter skyensis TaxID=97481 RepID=A0AAJ6NDZ2_9PAST|nr:glycosyltransferase family 52 [Pasteurella skyensis]MDP8171180.1 glycosyltransferase family 52 [Pasteurella skyensis]MDP8174985.1 glycosyltransferase family 52 [Pasteurella skyensis]